MNFKLVHHHNLVQIKNFMEIIKKFCHQSKKLKNEFRHIKNLLSKWKIFLYKIILINDLFKNKLAL